MNYDNITLATCLSGLFKSAEMPCNDNITKNICDSFWRDETTGMSPLLLSLQCRNFKATEMLLSYVSLESIIQNEIYDIENDERGKETCITFVHMLIAKVEKHDSWLIKNVFAKCLDRTPNEKQQFTDYLNLRMSCEVFIDLADRSSLLTKLNSKFKMLSNQYGNVNNANVKNNSSFNDKDDTHQTVKVTCFEYALLMGKSYITEEFFTLRTTYIQDSFVTQESIERLVDILSISGCCNSELFDKINQTYIVSNSIFANLVTFLKFLSKAVKNNNFNLLKHIFDEPKAQIFMRDSLILINIAFPIFQLADEDFLLHFLTNFVEKYVDSTLLSPLVTNESIEENILLISAANGHRFIVQYILEVMCDQISIDKLSLELVLNSALKYAVGKKHVEVIELIFTKMNNVEIDNGFWNEVVDVVQRTPIEKDFEFSSKVFKVFFQAKLTSDKKTMLQAAVKTENIEAVKSLLNDNEIRENEELLRSSFCCACDNSNAEIVYLLSNHIKDKTVLKEKIQSFSDFVERLVSKKSLEPSEQQLLSSDLNIELSLNVRTNDILLNTTEKTMTSNLLTSAANPGELGNIFLGLPASLRRTVSRMLIHFTGDVSKFYKFDKKESDYLKYMKYLNDIIIFNNQTISSNRKEFTTVLHLLVENPNKNVLVFMIENKIDILTTDSHGDTILHLLAKLSGINKEKENEYINITCLILNSYLNSIINSDWFGAKESQDRRHAVFIILTRLVFNRQSMSVVSYAAYHKANSFLKFLLEISIEKLVKKNSYTIHDYYTTELNVELPTSIDVTGLCEETMPTTLTHKKLREILYTITQQSNIHHNELNQSRTLTSDPQLKTLQRININANCSFIDILSAISQKKQDFIEILQIPVVRKLASQLSRDYRLTMIAVLCFHIIFMICATVVAVNDKWWEGITTDTFYNGTNSSPNSCKQTSYTTSILSIIVLYSTVARSVQLYLIMKTKYRQSVLIKRLDFNDITLTKRGDIIIFISFFILQTVPAITWLVLRLYCRKELPYVIAVYLCAGWIYTILYMKSYKKLHVFTAALVSVAKRVFYFVIAIVLFFPLGFGSALLIMLSYPPQLYNSVDIGSQIAYLSTKLSLNLGGYFDPDNPTHSDDLTRTVFIQILYSTSVIVTSLFTLNIIIAMMNERYEKVKRNKKLEWHVRTLRRTQNMRYAFPCIIKPVASLRSKMKRFHSQIRQHKNGKTRKSFFEKNTYSFCPNITFFTMYTKKLKEDSSK